MSRPRNAQPPTRTTPAGSSRSRSSRANAVGTATSATIGACRGRARAEVGTGAEHHALGGVACDVEASRGRRSALSSRLAEPYMRKTRSSGSRSMPPSVQGFATRRGDIPIGEIQRVNSSKAWSHEAWPRCDHLELVGMGEQCPDGARDRLARLVLTAADRQLDVRSHVCLRHARFEHDAEERGIRSAPDRGKHVVDRGVDRRRRAIAAILHVGSADVVRDAVDHRL